METHHVVRGQLSVVRQHSASGQDGLVSWVCSEPIEPFHRLQARLVVERIPVSKLPTVIRRQSFYQRGLRLHAGFALQLSTTALLSTWERRLKC